MTHQLRLPGHCLMFSIALVLPVPELLLSFEFSLVYLLVISDHTCKLVDKSIDTVLLKILVTQAGHFQNELHFAKLFGQLVGEGSGTGCDFFLGAHLQAEVLLVLFQTLKEKSSG